MSKSRGNVVNPDDIVKDWGADALRLYEMFMGPLTASKPWQTAGITGVYRFLKRVQRLVLQENGELSDKLIDAPMSDAFTRVLHKTVKKVGEDSQALQFNTAIAAMMELVNAAYKEPHFSRQAAEALVLLLAPYAPHLAEELWQKLGHGESLAYAPWPSYDPALTEDDQITISVQVAGKLRGTLQVSASSSKEDIIAAAKVLDSVQRHLEGKTLVKEIFVPGKIVNFVVR